MLTVLAPRGDDNCFSQDSFVYEFCMRHGYSVQKKVAGSYPAPHRAPEFVVTHNPDDLDDSIYLRKFGRGRSVAHLHYQLEYCADRESLSLSLTHASAAIVPAAFMADRLSARFPQLDCHVVANGVRKHLFYPSIQAERRAFRARHGIPERGKLIGYVGRLTQAKGLAVLESLCTQLEAIDAYLLIQFPYWHNTQDPTEKDRLSTVAANLQARSPARVFTFPDPAPRFPNRPARNFDALLMPSMSELQPMVVLEAIASGVPVIGTAATPFYDDPVLAPVRSIGLRLAELPKRFACGATDNFELAADEVSVLSNDLLALLSAHVPPSDQQRAALAHALPADFTDGVMYDRWAEIYGLYGARPIARRAS